MMKFATDPNSNIFGSIWSINFEGNVCPDKFGCVAALNVMYEKEFSISESKSAVFSFL